MTKEEELIVAMKDCTSELNMLSTKIGHLTERLYGANGYEGDIPRFRSAFDKFDERIGKLEEAFSSHLIEAAKLNVRQKLIIAIGGIIATGLITAFGVIAAGE